MPKILTNSKTSQKSPTISAQRNEVLYREDLKTGFGYALTGIAVTLALTGTLCRLMANLPNFRYQFSPFHYLPDLKGALTGFYEESVKATLETKTSEFKNLLEKNIAYGQQTQQALVAIALGIFLLLLIAYF
ncbi:1394_t:CDS:2 [Funneliformis geosporum]|uniref:1394_t:CDS:1 n=1 Tax=Funneliformis geosporum TaxID=1117311 RepID=A0A9W4SVU1_9GLOM|nr:1394_t:CDS:2 [Funneliformis geosporum]